MRLLPRPSDSSDYQGGLFNKQELVWLNLCSRVYMQLLFFKEQNNVVKLVNLTDEMF